MFCEGKPIQVSETDFNPKNALDHSANRDGKVSIARRTATDEGFNLVTERRTRPTPQPQASE